MLQQTEKDFRVLYQQLYEMFKAAVYIENDVLILMDFPARDDGPREAAPVATTWPWDKPDTSIMRRVSIAYGNSETNKVGILPGRTAWRLSGWC